MNVSGKSFVLRHVFKDVESMEENDEQDGDEEEYFNIPWNIFISREDGYLDCFVHCGKSFETGKWKIYYKLKVMMVNGKHEMESEDSIGNIDDDENLCNFGEPNFIEWEEMEKNHLVDGKLAVEVHVTIEKMVGIYKENLRCFDETMKAFSDIALTVEDETFYVSKLFLATHSPYFNSLFLGKFGESNKSEISLTGIDSDDFQNYLEVLYGDPAIDETTVEGLLILADMYQTEIVIRKCEEFLVEKSTKTMKKKLQLTIQYNLKNLKNKCLSEIKTIDDIRSVLPLVLQTDHSLTADLLEKSVLLR